MVAQTIELPNIRKFFVPDPGFLLVDADLAGADAQVVAWEADDEDLKSAFRAGLKIHIKNARDIFPEKTNSLSDADLKATDRSGGLYHDCKQAVHAYNYGASAFAVSASRGWSMRDAEEFKERWFFLHPKIKQWHHRIEDGLLENRTVTNKFGYRRVFFDRIEGILPDALAWIPQSTIAIITERGMCNVDERLLWLQLLLQVHDNVVFQVPFSRKRDLDLVRNELSITVPYDDPLNIPWEFKASSRSWGELESHQWPIT